MITSVEQFKALVKTGEGFELLKDQAGPDFTVIIFHMYGKFTMEAIDSHLVDYLLKNGILFPVTTYLTNLVKLNAL